MPKLYAFSIVLILAVGLLLGGQDGQSPRTTALLRGTIAFQGTLPSNPLPRMAGDPYCAALAPATPDALDDVIVYARPIGGPSSQPVPAASVVLDRRDCKYLPRTLTIQVGQKLILRNSDGTAHNAHGWPRINMSFNLSLLRQAESVQIFQSEEPPFPIRDDVHNWEVAYIGVFSHPYHTVSKLNGAYELALPSGVYEIGVWHEKLGTQTQSFGARPGDQRELNFVFK